jgi:hypothetical protein
MSSDPRPDLLSGPADALQTAIKEIRSAILLFAVVVLILIVSLGILQAEIPHSLQPLVYIVVIGAPVLWLAIEVLL